MHQVKHEQFIKQDCIHVDEPAIELSLNTSSRNKIVIRGQHNRNNKSVIIYHTETIRVVELYIISYRTDNAKLMQINKIQFQGFKNQGPYSNI
jgi:hypothetical protein